MRFLIVILVSVVSVVPGFATVDPDPDQIGIYFDSNADVTCIEAPPNFPFFAFLIITNPSSAEVRGIEFSMCTEFIGGNESLFFKLSEVWSAGFIEPAVVVDWCLEGRAIGFFDPAPQVDENVVLVQLQFMLLADMGVKFYLRPHPVETIEDGLPAYLGEGDILVPLGVSSGDPSLPVAAVNGECNVISVESKTFSGLKCLYR